MNRSIDIESADGIIDARIHTPDGTRQALPAVVLFTDIGGLRPCYDEKAQRIADAGYAVLMPNIYYRDQAGEVVPPGQSFHDSDVLPVLRGYAAHLPPAALARDFEALLMAIDSEAEFAPGPVCTAGYCMTGAFALRMAALRPDRLVAAAGFHSSRLAVEDDNDSPLHIVEKIRGSVFLGHADGDKLMPPEQIGRLDSALAAAGIDFSTELFKGAAHGFTAKDASAYNAAADARHYKRLLTLFEEALAG